MSSKHTPRADEGLMMMQELEDRLREHTDKLEHIRLSTVELRDTLSGKEEDDVQECVCEHVQWLAQLSDRLENLQMNTAVFVQVWRTSYNFSFLFMFSFPCFLTCFIFFV
ncbi:hypothetical protein F2P79_007624 [Pimephales promelas]|nr:hypothetical protein F2P79_007624 [Pimephales promelas]